MPTRILITGYSGFVGGYLVEACRQHYPQATVFGLGLHGTSAALRESQDIHVLSVDIVEREAVREAMFEALPDLVFHLAAQSSVAVSWEDPVGTLRANAEGTLHLLDALREAHLTPRILLVGSCEQYGMVRPEENPIREENPFRPANPYAVSKATQDLYGYQYALTYGLPIIRTRSFNHFGPRQSPTFALASFARQIALIEAGHAQPVLAVGNLQARRDFLPVADVIDAYLALAERGHPGEAYNIGSGHARSIRAMLDILLGLARTSVELYEDPARLRPVDVPLLEADTTRLRSHTGWEARIPLEQALQELLDYWREAVAERS